MAKNKDFTRIVTANRLRDGYVVFLTTEGAWSEKTEAAAVAKTTEQEEALLAQAQASVRACHVVDPTVIDVDQADTSAPLRFRERIRRAGPTVRPDLARAL